jgi:hypothetical protein
MKLLIVVGAMFVGLTSLAVPTSAFAGPLEQGRAAASSAVRTQYNQPGRDQFPNLTTQTPSRRARSPGPG